jgi:hypothetical protein
MRAVKERARMPRLIETDEGSAGEHPFRELVDFVAAAIAPMNRGRLRVTRHVGHPRFDLGVLHLPSRTLAIRAPVARTRDCLGRTGWASARIGTPSAS